MTDFDSTMEGDSADSTVRFSFTKPRDAPRDAAVATLRGDSVLVTFPRRMLELYDLVDDGVYARERDAPSPAYQPLR